MEVLSQKTNRFLSLDIFRGLTICLMIIVNTPGTGAELYPYLVHAQWFGFTLADLVFPSFLFAMGNAMSFSMERLKQKKASFFWKKIIRRTFLIFLIGFLMYWFPFIEQLSDGSWSLKPFSETRVMGVLQRIALCYFFTSILFYYLSQKTALIISGALLLLYWAILYVFGDSAGVYDMATNAAGKFDLAILGENHIYKKDRIPFDPEGILSTLPSIVNVIFGYIAGAFVQKKGKTFEAISVLLISGFLIASLGLWWELIFPMSKKLWTSPFVLYTVGLDLSIMAILIYAIELRNIKFGVNFLNVFGKNPLFIYLFSELFYISLRNINTPSGLDAFEWVSERIFQSISPGSFGALVTALVFMMLCWLLGWWLDKRKIYIKL